MTQEQAAELLQKYLAGEASENEIMQIEHWYGSLPLTDALSDDRKKLIAENMRVHLNKAMHQRTTKTQLLYRPWIRVAAVLLMLTTLGLVFRNHIPVIHNSSEQTVFTGSHQRKIITLPDGSTVTMEPSSAMVYPSRFPATIRAVKLLKGDAFFSVAHDVRRPFTVRLNSHIQVKVLGTSFNIHDVENESLLKVTVASGKVAVQKGTTMLGTLTRGQELTFHKRTQQASVSQTLHPTIVKLSFEHSTLAEVIRKMEYIYSIRIQVSHPEFLKLKCRAEFNSGQQPTEILDILCSLHHLRFSQSKDHKSFKIHP